MVLHVFQTRLLVFTSICKSDTLEYTWSFIWEFDENRKVIFEIQHLPLLLSVLG